MTSLQVHMNCSQTSICTNLSYNGTQKTDLSFNVTQQTRLNCDLILARVLLISVLISVEQRIWFVTPEITYSCTNSCVGLCLA